jgi:integrase
LVLHGLLDATKPEIARRRFRDLRHSAASLLIAAGVELVEVSLLLGDTRNCASPRTFTRIFRSRPSRAAEHTDALLGVRNR